MLRLQCPNRSNCHFTSNATIFISSILIFCAISLVYEMLIVESFGILQVHFVYLVFIICCSPQIALFAFVVYFCFIIYYWTILCICVRCVYIANLNANAYWTTITGRLMHSFLIVTSWKKKCFASEKGECNQFSTHCTHIQRVDAVRVNR